MVFFSRIHKKSSGFTLVEIVVVVSIIGLLASAGLYSYNEAREQARDKVRQSSLQEVKLALEAYKQLHGVYPERCERANGTSGYVGGVRAGVPLCADKTINGVPVPGVDVPFIFGDNPTANPVTQTRPFVPTFISSLPRDPSFASLPNNWGYLYITDGQNYQLSAHYTVESEDVNYGHPMARCPTWCIGHPDQGPNCTDGNAAFDDSYAVYGGTDPAALCTW